MKRTLRSMAVVAMVVWCAGCGSSAAQSKSIDCAAIIDSTEDVPEGFEATVLDVVSLPAYELDAGTRQGDEGTDVEGFTFSKFGLVVRAETAVTIEVADAGTATAALDWATTGSPRVGVSVKVGPCRGSESQVGLDDGEWVVFAGGVWVSEPTCVTLQVSAGGDSASHRLGVGETCAS